MKEKEVKAYFEIVQSIAKMSYCERLQVGSIITKNNSIIAYGFNGTVAGDDNICEINDVTKPNVVHAEANALYKCAKSNESSDGATMFITHSPCMPCAMAIVQCGIKAVYFINPYRDSAPIEYLQSKGITVIQRENFNGTT